MGIILAKQYSWCVVWYSVIMMDSSPPSLKYYDEVSLSWNHENMIILNSFNQTSILSGVGGKVSSTTSIPMLLAVPIIIETIPSTSWDLRSGPVVASRLQPTHHTSGHTRPERSLYCGQRSERSGWKPILKRAEGGRANSDAIIVGSEHHVFFRSGRPWQIDLTDVLYWFLIVR